MLVAFCALGFGLFSQGELASLYLNDNLHIHNVLTRGLVLSLSGIAALPLKGPALAHRLYGPTAGTPPRPSHWSAR